MVAGLLVGCADAQPKLSEMEDAQLFAYLADAGVTVPEDVTASTVREMVAELEDDPAHSAPAVSFTLIIDLYEDIRIAVNAYYGN